MNIAYKLRQDSIVDYLIYMWQVEDMIRACMLDKEQVEKLVLSRYQIPSLEMQEVRRRYMELTDMMLTEGLRKRGHLSIHQIVLMEIEELHKHLLADPKEYIYNSLYLQVLPSIIGLRDKNRSAVEERDESLCTGEIETAMEAVYGYTVLRLRGIEVSDDTMKALSRIAGFLTMLSEKYKTKDLPPE